MKKSALLAVSALSLGVVGLATFTPMVNAITSTTGDATVTVHVQEALAIGGDGGGGEIAPGEEDQPVDMSAMNVDFGDVKAGSAVKKVTKSVAINNNSGHAGILTIKAADTNLSGGAGKSIPAGTVTGTDSSWGYNVDGGDTFKAVTTSPVELGSDSGTEQKTYSVTFGLITSKTQAAGDYNGTVTYNYTINDL